MSRWSDYRETRKVKFTFEEFGLDDLWVEVMPIATYGSHEMQRVAEFPEEEQHIEMFKLWIEDWNFPEEESDDILPIPREDEENRWMSIVPQEIQVNLITQIGAIEEERMNVPPLKERRSSQP